MALGGRAAEEIVFGDITTGASGDISTVTKTARSMITRYGMSAKLGPIAFGEKDELIFLGREISEQRNYSEDVAKIIDEEVHRLVSEAYHRAMTILEKYRPVLNDMANALLEFETLEGDRLRDVLGRIPRGSFELNGKKGGVEKGEGMTPEVVAPKWYDFTPSCLIQQTYSLI